MKTQNKVKYEKKIFLKKLRKISKKTLKLDLTSKRIKLGRAIKRLARGSTRFIKTEGFLLVLFLCVKRIAREWPKACASDEIDRVAELLAIGFDPNLEFDFKNATSNGLLIGFLIICGLLSYYIRLKLC